MVGYNYYIINRGCSVMVARVTWDDAERFESDIFYHNIEVWCNGSTTHFDCVGFGSNPDISANN